jgi:hypothetical protein
LQLQSLDEICLCLPGSNALLNLFSLQWTWYGFHNDRDCVLQTVKSMLTVLTNFPMTCQKFAAKFVSRQDILKKVHSSEKYNWSCLCHKTVVLYSSINYVLYS